MTRDEERLRRLSLVIDLRACAREWGDSETMTLGAAREAWAEPIDRLETLVARWIRIIEGKRSATR